MKPQERFFFMYVLCRCEYRQYFSNCLLYKVVENFSKVFAIPEKQLWYYVEKWSRKGFWNYGVSLAGGWFEWEELTGEYKQIAHKFQLKNRDGSPWTEGKKIKLEDVIKTEGKTWTYAEF